MQLHPILMVVPQGKRGEGRETPQYVGFLYYMKQWMLEWAPARVWMINQRGGITNRPVLGKR